MPETRGLGRGIRALIPEGSPEMRQEQAVRLPLKSIQPGKYQPRQSLDESKIQELANSIKESGLIYPILVRKIDKSGLDEPIYEIIAGERRFRALALLGETEVPAIIKEVSDRQALELSLIENLQREELGPIEQAQAYQRLGDEFRLTQEEIATRVGKDRATVANTLRLLRLAAPVREELIRGSLTLGHARALLALESEQRQLQLAKRIAREGLSVRQVEQMVRGASPTRSRSRAARDPHLVSAEEQLRRSLGTNVQLLHGKSRGWIRIAYYSLKDLDRLLKRLT